MRKVLFAIVLSFLGTYVFSDDGHGFINEKLGEFSLLNSSSIEMASEHVDIYEDHVTVSFNFHNTTEENQHVVMGFPIIDYPAYSTRQDEEIPYFLPDDLSRIERIYNFESSVNGQKVPRKLVIANHNSGMKSGFQTFYYVSEVDFKPDETIRIVDTYLTKPDTWMVNDGSHGSNLTYILRTGATWSGVIGKATVVYHDFGPPPLFEFDSLSGNTHIRKIDFKVSPTSSYQGGSRAERVYQWDFENLKPDFDIQIEKSESIDRPLYIDSVLAVLLGNGLTKVAFSENASYHNPYKVPVDFSRLSEAERTEYANELYRSGERFFREILDSITMAIASLKDKKKTTNEAEFVRSFGQFVVNGTFALNGYSFKSDSWRNVFSGFSWYKPSSSEVPNFSDEDQARIDAIGVVRKE